jgi:hypothetical protein
MLGYLNGRVYYNLRSWYKMMAMLPGYSFNARFMEKMMGVKERFDLDDSDRRSKYKDFFRIVYMIFNILKNLIGHKTNSTINNLPFFALKPLFNSAFINILPE